MTETTPRYPIRVATADTLKDYSSPLLVAFGEEMSEAEFDDWRRTAEPERFIAAFDGEVPVGAAAAYSFRLTVPGGEVAAAGVTAVGVEPGHRRQGILRSLMRQQLDDVRARGEPVAVLWASESVIYQRFGYGMATLSGSLEIERARTAWLRPVEPAGRMRLVGLDEALATFPAVYERVRLATPGALSRSEAWWRWATLHDAEYTRRGAGPKYLYLCEIDGRPEGYAIYRVKSEWEERGPKSELLVVEALAVNPAAERTVWGFLFGVDLIRTISARRVTVPPSLLLALADPRALGLRVSDGLWLRLVDLSAALAARRYGGPGSLAIEVTDAFCPWNAGRWRITAFGEPGAAGAEASVERTDGAPDLVADTTDIAAAYLGAVRLSDLARAGRVEERTPGALRLADAMFGWDRAPSCTTMF
jgi:predicted acetyltransferase